MSSAIKQDESRKVRRFIVEAMFGDGLDTDWVEQCACADPIRAEAIRVSLTQAYATAGAFIPCRVRNVGRIRDDVSDNTQVLCSKATT